MSLLGAVTGVALGAASGVALARSLADEGITTVDVPVGTLAVYAGIAVAIGVLAALAPARQASKVNLLRALSAE
jgi:putative ABC transport system permease protein